MEINLGTSWNNVLADEFDKPYFRELVRFVESEYASGSCYPPMDEIFSAFRNCPFDAVKVVIIGQDPYHGAEQANGHCFSVHDGIAFPPSLRNIFEEIRNDTGKAVPKSGNLEHWARQGVLLLNATLTVKEGAAGSHQNKGWELFTDAVIRKISEEKKDIVFLLWGGYAKKKGAVIDRSRHFVLESGHPSPLSANRGHWFGNHHFSRTNEFLRSKQKAEISW
jgi:uracil-DNA glycosylase